jgi:hypothetical protein
VNKRSFLLSLVLGAISVHSFTGAVSAADIKVMISGGLTAAYRELVLQFEAEKHWIVEPPQRRHSFSYFAFSRTSSSVLRKNLTTSAIDRPRRSASPKRVSRF